MFTYIKRTKRLINIIDSVIAINQGMLKTLRPFVFCVNHPSQTRLYKVIPSTSFLKPDYEPQMIILRNKSKAKRASKNREYDSESSDEEDQDETEDEVDEVDKKLMAKSFTLPSIRVDLVLKNVLKIARKKVEDAFYHNRIRINGKVILKKSQNVQIDDEIDLIKGTENSSSNTIKVERIKILNIKEDEDEEKYILKVQVFKSLIINNYAERHAWRQAVEES